MDAVALEVVEAVEEANFQIHTLKLQEVVVDLDFRIVQEESIGLGVERLLVVGGAMYPSSIPSLQKNLAVSQFKNVKEGNNSLEGGSMAVEGEAEYLRSICDLQKNIMVMKILIFCCIIQGCELYYQLMPSKMFYLLCFFEHAY